MRSRSRITLRGVENKVVPSVSDRNDVISGSRKEHFDVSSKLSPDPIEGSTHELFEFINWSSIRTDLGITEYQTNTNQNLYSINTTI